MTGEAADAPLHGLAEGEASVVSVRSSASSSDTSFRSSAAWSTDMDLDDDDDDGDAMYKLMKSEYEEIPSFRWIPSPLRWWKTRRTGRKSSHLSRRSNATGAASSGEEPGPSAVTEAEPCGEETAEKLVHFDSHLVFAIAELLTASAEVLGLGLGRGTYGTAYAATLKDGIKVVVKRVRNAERISTDEFRAEVNVLGKIRHPNLLALRSCYCSQEEKLMILDYMPKGCLSAFLHGKLDPRDYMPKGCFAPFFHVRGTATTVDWHTRMKIAMGVARGLLHLHSHENMVHGNLTGTNILLDDHTEANIADYGLSRLRTAVTDSRMMAATETFGYRAPELSRSTNKANTKTDVYSFGVVMLELLTGKSPLKAVNGLELVQWVNSLVDEGRIHDAFDPELMKEAGTMGDEMLLNCLYLALQCADTSPHVRPEVLQVLQQLEEIEQGLAGATTRVGDEQNDEGHGLLLDTGITPTTWVDSSPYSALEMAEGRTAPRLEDTGSATSETSNVSANGGKLEAGMLENIRSFTFVSPASGAETMPSPLNSSKKEIEQVAKSGSQGDIEEGIIQGHLGNGELQPQNVSDVETTSGNQSPATDIKLTTQPDRNSKAPFLFFHMYESPIQVPKVEEAQQIEDASPTTELEEVPKTLLISKRIEGGISTKGIDVTSRGLGVSPPPSINWAEVTLEARLEVPPTAPLISSEPDSGYRRYFQTLYHLAHRSPPLSSTVLRVQLNRMVMGLHSLGYPLDAWLKVATLVLVHTEKREYIERCVDDHKVHVEARLAEFSEIVAPVQVEISRTQSCMTTQELKQEQLDEAIAELEDQLAVLKAQREEISNLLVTTRDQFVVTQAKMEALSADIGYLNQQQYVISDWQSAMLRELPSLDTIFDSVADPGF